jgi:hypothetical protein
MDMPRPEKLAVAAERWINDNGGEALITAANAQVVADAARLLIEALCEGPAPAPAPAPARGRTGTWVDGGSGPGVELPPVEDYVKVLPKTGPRPGPLTTPFPGGEDGEALQ